MIWPGFRRVINLKRQLASSAGLTRLRQTVRLKIAVTLRSPNNDRFTFIPSFSIRSSHKSPRSPHGHATTSS